MLNRRNAVIALGIAAMGGCNELSTFGRKSALRAFDVSVPSEVTTRFLARVRGFADNEGFVFRARNIASSIGVSHTFAARRRDIWVEGLNLPRDVPNPVPTNEAGEPVYPLEIDQTRFRVIFYAGDVQPSAAVLDEVVEKFSRAVQEVSGVIVLQVQ